MRCPIRGCGEPWDLDTLHDQISADNPDKPWVIDGKHDQKVYEEQFFDPMVKKFQREGCEALDSTHNIGEEEVGHHGLAASETYSALSELLGDDVDGIEAMMQDEGF